MPQCKATQLRLAQEEQEALLAELLLLMAEIAYLVLLQRQAEAKGEMETQAIVPTVEVQAAEATALLSAEPQELPGKVSLVEMATARQERQVQEAAQEA